MDCPQQTTDTIGVCKWNPKLFPSTMIISTFMGNGIKIIGTIKGGDRYKATMGEGRYQACKVSLSCTCMISWLFTNSTLRNLEGFFKPQYPSRSRLTQATIRQWKGNHGTAQKPVKGLWATLIILQHTGLITHLYTWKEISLWNCITIILSILRKGGYQVAVNLQKLPGDTGRE